MLIRSTTDLPNGGMNEIEEAEVEAGFIIGSCCCSLEIEEDDEYFDGPDVMEGDEMVQRAGASEHAPTPTDKRSSNAG